MAQMLLPVCAVDTRQLGMAEVGGGRQVALECPQAPPVGREPVAQSSPAQIAARQAQRVPPDATRTGKVGVLYEQAVEGPQSCCCSACTSIAAPSIFFGLTGVSSIFGAPPCLHTEPSQGIAAETLCAELRESLGFMYGVMCVMQA